MGTVSAAISTPQQDAAALELYDEHSPIWGSRIAFDDDGRRLIDYTCGAHAGEGAVTARRHLGRPGPYRVTAVIERDGTVRDLAVTAR
jgi:hypothetical protein